MTSSTWRGCIHESGHAVSAIVLGLPIASATTSEVRLIDWKKQECDTLAVMLLAAGQAEAIVFGGEPIYDARDRAQASLYLEAYATKDSREHRRHLAACRVRARALVTLRQTEIEHIARALQRKGRLDRRDFEQLTKRWHQ